MRCALVAGVQTCALPIYMPSLVAQLVEEADQDDAIEHGDTEHRDATDRRWHRQILAGHEQRNQGSDGGERYVGQYQRAVLGRIERGIEQHEDEEERDWHDYRQLYHRTLMIIERAAPLDTVQ